MIFNIKLAKRHIAKTITWRFIATSDTVLIAFLISGDLTSGLKIGGIEILTKMILYYLHERLWFNKIKVINSRIRHLAKSFSWRLIGTLDTIIISGFVIGNFISGSKIGLIETFTKIFLYYIHERLWYRINFGLKKYNQRRRIEKRKNAK